MAHTYDAKDYVEHTSSEVMEQFGNFANYNVITGCEATYSDTGMTATVAAGVVIHNGTRLTVAGNDVTLVADGSNPRWTWIGVDSSGVAHIDSGTAAANPSIPALSDYVPVALVKIEAAQTIAANCATKLDKRTLGLRVPSSSAVVLAKDYTVSSDTLTVIPNFSIDLAASTTYIFRSTLWYTEVGSGYYIVSFTPTNTSTSRVIAVATDSGGTSGIFDGSSLNGFSGYGYGATSPGVISAQGVIVTGTSAGQLNIRTRKSPSGTSVTTKAKSRLEVF